MNAARVSEIRTRRTQSHANADNAATNCRDSGFGPVVTLSCAALRLGVGRRTVAPGPGRRAHRCIPEWDLITWLRTRTHHPATERPRVNGDIKIHVAFTA